MKNGKKKHDKGINKYSSTVSRGVATRSFWQCGASSVYVHYPLTLGLVHVANNGLFNYKCVEIRSRFTASTLEAAAALSSTYSAAAADQPSSSPSSYAQFSLGTDCTETELPSTTAGTKHYTQCGTTMMTMRRPPPAARAATCCHHQQHHGE